MTPAPFQILVVEDNEVSRELLGEMLAVLGHETCCVANAEAALEIFKKKHFDILLADINLPGISGVALAERLTAVAPGLNVIFASGYGYLVADKTDYDFILLPKPYGHEQLRHAIASLRSPA